MIEIDTDLLMIATMAHPRGQKRSSEMRLLDFVFARRAMMMMTIIKGKDEDLISTEENRA